MFVLLSIDLHAFPWRSPTLSLSLSLSLSQSYTGSDLQWRVNGLEPRSEYTIKVAAVRVPGDASDVELVGAFSPPSVFNTLGGNSADGGPGGAGGPGGDAAKPGGNNRGAGLVATAVSCERRLVLLVWEWRRQRRVNAISARRASAVRPAVRPPHRLRLHDVCRRRCRRRPADDGVGRAAKLERPAATV